jgi:hypothetical protein
LLVSPANISYTNSRINDRSQAGSHLNFRIEAGRRWSGLRQGGGSRKRNEMRPSDRRDIPARRSGCASEMLFYEMNRRRIFDALTTIVNRANTAQ